MDGINNSKGEYHWQSTNNLKEQQQLQDLHFENESLELKDESTKENKLKQKDELQFLREEIDNLDKELVSLFEKRLELALKVAQYKKANKLPIFHKEREEQVIKKNVDKLKNKEFSSQVQNLFTRLMELSRGVQENYMNK